MTISLDNAFVSAAQREPFEVIFGEDRLITLQRSDAISAGRFRVSPELEVLEDGEVVGYITAYSDREHGAVQAHMFGLAMPAVFDTLDGALREILR